jgi:uncharacterized membrane protein YczE
LPRRLLQLLVGLTLFGVAMSLMIRSGTGMLPWDVLHYGVASHLPLSIGTVIILTGVAVLLMWIPLRQVLRLVRTGIELAVVSGGWLLGGVVGPGTLLFALAIGPLTQFFLPYFTVALRVDLASRARTSEPSLCRSRNL